MGERYWLEGNTMKDVHEYLRKYYPNFCELGEKTNSMFENDTNSVNPRSKEMLKKLIKTRYFELRELLVEIEDLEAELEELESSSSDVDKSLKNQETV